MHMKFINALVVKVKDEIIKFEDVELNLPNEVTETRNYQYDL